MAFKALQLNETILKALADEGYETPTPIQAKAIPPILEGKDVLGCAQTGTGKTAAFALPMIQRLSERQLGTEQAAKNPLGTSGPHGKHPLGTSETHGKHPLGTSGPHKHRNPRALILSPTRELAAQIGESFATYGRHAGLSHTVIFGGVSQFHQVKAIHRGVDILVATPGRLIDLMDQRIVTLKEVGIFVLDEADRMLDMGFIEPIRRIASQLPRPRQTLLFSATMPKEIMHLADSLLRDPVKVAVTPVSSLAPKIDQKLYMVPTRQKMALLEYVLEDAAVERVVVFTKTKHGADRVCKNLNHDGVPAVAIHGNKAQNYRTRALDGFKSGKTRVLVATDVAARGLDVEDITHVVNFDLPMEPEAYVHRIGRTGRAGKTGIAISFCDAHERDLLRGIQKLTGKQIPVEPLPTDMPTNDHAMGRHGAGHGGHGQDDRREPRGGGHRERGERGGGRGYEQRFGQSEYRREGGRGGHREGGHRDGGHRDGGSRAGGRPAFAGTVNVVVTDEHRPVRSGHGASVEPKGGHAERGRHESGSHGTRGGHGETRQSSPTASMGGERPAHGAEGQRSGGHGSSSHGTGGHAAGGHGAAGKKKMHRKGFGPATKPTRSGPMGPESKSGQGEHGGRGGHGARDGQREGRGGHGGQTARGGPGGHGGHFGQGGSGGRGRRGGPGGGTRGKLFSRGPRQGR